MLLFLLRRSENISHNEPGSIHCTNKIGTRNTNQRNENRRNASYNAKSSTVVFQSDILWFNVCARKIDFIAAIIFPVAYFLFNIIYWVHYWK